MIDSSNLEEIVIELKRQFGADDRHQYKTFEDFEDDSKDRKKLTTLTEREIISTNFNCPAKMVHLDQLQGFYSYQTKSFQEAFDLYLEYASTNPYSEVEILNHIMDRLDNSFKKDFGAFNESLMQALLLNAIYSYKYNHYLMNALKDSPFLFRHFDNVQFDLYQTFNEHFNYDGLPNVQRVWMN